MNPDETEVVEVTDEEMLEWIRENADLASETLARALDQEADELGRSQRARLTRVLATDAWKLHMHILGLEEMWVREEEESAE